VLEALTAPWFHLAGIPLSIGDVSGFATGLVCVALAAKGSILNFPFALVNSLILGAVFFQARLFGDMTLQAVFFALGVIGWIQWASAGAGGATRPKDYRTLDFAVGALVVVSLTLVLRKILVLMGGAAPWPDAVITSASLWAQWLLNRKSISSWAWWIGVDLVSVPLYWSRSLPLIAILYVVFLGLCVQGWLTWRRQLA
jgi:nicotinamide mononucleotide transporter